MAGNVDSFVADDVTIFMGDWKLAPHVTTLPTKIF